MPKSAELVIPNANRRLKTICSRGLKQLFGENPPQAVKKRLEHELMVVAKNKHSSYYLLASLLAKEAERLEYAFILRGIINSSLIAYTSGATKINPMEEKYGGVNLPFEVTREEYHAITPCIDIQCSTAFVILAQSFINRELPEYRTLAYPLRSEPDGRAVRIMFSKTQDLPISEPEIKDESWGFPDLMFFYDYYYITLIGDPLMELVAYNTYSEKRTSFIEAESGPLISKLWKYTKDHDTSIKGYKRLKVKTYEALVTVCGMAHSTNVWRGLAKKMILEGSLSLEDMIGTRDDLFTYLCRLGYDKKRSFEMMENVRKGKGLSKEEYENMKTRGAEEWVIDLCKNTMYLFPRGHIAQLIRRNAFCLTEPGEDEYYYPEVMIVTKDAFSTG